MKESLTTAILICLTFANVAGQKFALIDRDFKKPILYTDSVTVSQVSNNLFPIKVTDLDSLIGNLKFVQNELKGLQRAKFVSYKLSSGQTATKVVTVSKAYGDSYNVFLTTAAGLVVADYLLVDNRQLNKRGIKKIQEFIDYIKTDKALTIHDFIEYHPVLYDATVFIHSK